MNADDRENARRLDVFEDGQKAQRQGYGHGANPHRSGSLEHEIWSNGLEWQGGERSGKGARLFVIGVGFAVLLMTLIVLIRQ